MKIIDDLFAMRRDLISDGFDEALNYLSKLIPLRIHRYPTGSNCWTWTIPKKWSVTEAYIEALNGDRLVDLKNHPLHVASYSCPIDEVVDKDEIMRHLYFSEGRPSAIPFAYKYYDKTWGFCIQKDRMSNFVYDKYRVVIKSKFEDGEMKVGECTLKGKTDNIVVLASHLCHPGIANDDLSGVSVMVDIYNVLKDRNNYYTYQFLFVPETIGSIAYLSHNADILLKSKCGIFMDMMGNKEPLSLQYSKLGNTPIDRIAKRVFAEKFQRFEERKYLAGMSNDEKVFDSPGVDIPMVAINRSPYPEYHTSDDNPDIISEDKLNESKDVVLKIIDIFDRDYIPVRNFTGPVFLSKYGLWVDWHKDYKLNKAIDQIMLRMEGDKTVFDISEEVGLSFNDTVKYVDMFHKQGLITKTWIA
jgi:aminopeptidase-like protein